MESVPQLTYEIILLFCGKCSQGRQAEDLEKCGVSEASGCGSAVAGGEVGPWSRVACVHRGPHPGALQLRPL